MLWATNNNDNKKVNQKIPIYIILSKMECPLSHNKMSIGECTPNEGA